MKKIYLVVTETGTLFSKMIKRHTKNRYNHISISLSPALEEMYSFGRRNPYIFFWGGFVIERPHSGIYKVFSKTNAKVLEVPVSDQSFEIIKSCIDQFVRDKNTYSYNFRGLLKARKNVRYQGSYRKFYCSQFVNYLLVCAHVITEDHFGAIVKPEDFCKLEGSTLLFEGRFSDYKFSSESAPL